MRSAQLTFDWEHRKPPERLTFAFYFRPILPRLRPLHWICSYWPLLWPRDPRAGAALQLIDGDITPPDTILPDLSDQIVGDRNEFYGAATPPDRADDFYTARAAASARDMAEWSAIPHGTIDSPTFRRAQQRYAEHVRAHGTHLDRFLDAWPVEFAFMTNDTAWWVFARDDAVVNELSRYAETVPGMSCRATAAFGM